MATIGWFRPGVEESQAAASNIRHVLEPSDLEVDDPAPAFPAAADRRRGLHPVHVGQHGPAARRRAEPRQRGAHGGVHGGGRAAHPRRRGGLVAAALPRHGADRLRVHPALERGAAPPAAARSQEPAGVARAGHPGPRHLHGLARLRLPQLRAQHPRHERPRSLLAQAGALRRRAGAPQHHRGLRAEVRHAEPHHPLLRPGRGHAGGGDLAAPDAAPPGQLGPVPLGGPALPGRARAHHGRRGGGQGGRRGRDLRPEPRGDAGLLQQPRGHPEASSRPTAGSAPATWASSTPRASSTSPDGSRT